MRLPRQVACSSTLWRSASDAWRRVRRSRTYSCLCPSRRDVLHDPVVHSVGPSAGTVSTMEHHVLVVHGPDRYAVTTGQDDRAGAPHCARHDKLCWPTPEPRRSP
ncbi:hypothetical protein CGZ69_32405 [Streptomyces peucetius subsp. caesius ATCC 27952]|nr:hypothetical protein CGZ69_32405 [Streptomyces peucetius subsp. caesius ATCC 27952]